MPKMKRPELQQFVIPDAIQQLLRQIADIEDRSKSAVVRKMIVRRAEELGITDTEQSPETSHA